MISFNTIRFICLIIAVPCLASSQQIECEKEVRKKWEFSTKVVKRDTIVDKVTLNSLSYGKFSPLRVVFHCHVSIEKVNIRTIDFNHSLFLKNTRFTKSTFSENANFNSSGFHNFTDFSNVIFGENADFERAYFGAPVSFFGTVMPKRLNFSNINLIDYPIDLSYALPPKNAKESIIDLFGTDLSKVKINYTAFRLPYLDDARNGVLHVDGIPLDLKKNIYETLLKKQEEDGFSEGYKKLDIEYKQFLYNLRGQWYWNVLQKYWWNYGYAKERIFVITPLFFFLFFIINYFCFSSLMLKVYKIPSIWKFHQKVKWSTRYGPKSKKFQVVHVVSIFYYTLLVFFGVTFSLDKLKFKNLVGVGYILTSYVIGLICLVYIVNNFTFR